MSISQVLKAWVIRILETSRRPNSSKAGRLGSLRYSTFTLIVKVILK
jgi:hypothetical protein